MIQKNPGTAVNILEHTWEYYGIKMHMAYWRFSCRMQSSRSMAPQILLGLSHIRQTLRTWWYIGSQNLFSRGARTRTATMATDTSVSTNMITSITNTHCDPHHHHQHHHHHDHHHHHHHPHHHHHHPHPHPHHHHHPHPHHHHHHHHQIRPSSATTLPQGGLGEELKGEAHAQVMEIWCLDFNRT